MNDTISITNISSNDNCTYNISTFNILKGKNNINNDEKYTINNLLKENEFNQYNIIRNISKEKQLKLLESINTTINKIDSSINKSYNTTYFNNSNNKKDVITKPMSNKPLWNDNTHKIITNTLGQISSKDLENVDFNYSETLINDNEDDYLNNNKNNSSILTSNNFSCCYPLNLGIKKLLFAYGDYIYPCKSTIIFIHKKINIWFKSILNIIDKCEYNTVLDHLYSKEYFKFNEFKKYKNKSTANNKINNLDISNTNNSDASYNNNNNNNVNNIGNENSESEDLLSLFSNNNDNYIESKNDNELIRDNNILLTEEFNDDYKEILEFENERAKVLSKDLYLELCDAKSIAFGGKNKKYFIKYLSDIAYKNNIINVINNELKDNNCIDLLSFIIKKRIKNVVIKANKNRNNNSLKILTSPILINEIDTLIDEENKYLEEFINDLSKSIYLMDSFIKRSNKLISSTNNNKKLKLISNNNINNKNINIINNDNKIIIEIKKRILNKRSSNKKLLKKNTNIFNTSLNYRNKENTNDTMLNNSLIDNVNIKLNKKQINYINKKISKYFKSSLYYSFKQRKEGKINLMTNKAKLKQDYKIEYLYEYYLLCVFICNLFEDNLLNSKQSEDHLKLNENSSNKICDIIKSSSCTSNSDNNSYMLNKDIIHKIDKNYLEKEFIKWEELNEERKNDYKLSYFNYIK